MRTLTIFILALGLTACGEDKPGNGPPDLGWELVWADEFDGPAGELPDPAKWTFDVGGDGWGNEQLEYNTDSASNVALDGDGNLAITARAETVGDNDYTSGRIKTKGLFELTYGRIEARIKLPQGKGIWPAFWMLGGNFDEVGWPACGEIDIMEYRGQEPFLVHGSLHGPGYFGGGPITDSFELPEGQAFSDDFHVFAVEWDVGRVVFSVDDEVYQVVTTTQVPFGGRWVYDHPFFLLLNVAVGGTFVGAPNDSTPFPQTMLVDYVRVYARPIP